MLDACERMGAPSGIEAPRTLQTSYLTVPARDCRGPLIDSWLDRQTLLLAGWLAWPWREVKRVGVATRLIE